MKPDYFALLSPEPIYIHPFGGVKCPTLREISQLSYDTYYLYLSLLLITPKSYFAKTSQADFYENLSDEDKSSFHAFDLLTLNPSICSLLESALGFFLTDTVKYHKQHHAFLLYRNTEQTEPAGCITKENWPQLCELILKRNYLKASEEDLTKVKSKRALSIAEKLQKGRKNKEKNTSTDTTMELGNIISAVANKSSALNILNIWDITVYQLWDAFYRICHNNLYDIQAISVAAYGDKEHHFDMDGWFKKQDF